MEKVGIEIFNPKKFLNPKIQNKNFVVTGTLNSYSRDESKDQIRLAGGNIQSADNSATDYLICGENPGSKKETAEKLGVKILDEEGFKELLKKEEENQQALF